MTQVGDFVREAEGRHVGVVSRQTSFGGGRYAVVVKWVGTGWQTTFDERDALVVVGSSSRPGG